MEGSFLRWFVGAVFCLALLFALLGPPPTAGLHFPVAWFVWVLHIGTGLVLAIGAARLVSALPFAGRWSPLLRLGLAGALGALAFTPIAMGLEQVLPQGPRSPDADGSDGPGEAGVAIALLSELRHMGPQYLASWFLLNLRPMAEGVRLAAPVPDSLPVVPAPTAPVVPEPRAQSPADRWLSALPPALGTDLVSVSSDLHYLHVTTRRGRTTQLGNISAVEAALGDAGLRIHRSHLVAVTHVRSIRRGGRGWVCELDDGRRLEVSRRRIAAVRARLGAGFTIDG